MSLSGIFSSPTQRRLVLFVSSIVIIVCIALFLVLAPYIDGHPVREAANNIAISVLASGVFALLSTIGLSYFKDPNVIRAGSLILPQDITENLRRLSSGPNDYRIYARTGRHFRAETLPSLISQARESRHPIRLDVILLDFRNIEICNRYASFRKAASFDRHLWSPEYVEKEVLATIIAVVEAVQANRPFIEARLHLSNRLSTFRIEGTADEIMVTREDPKDFAYCYSREHRDFAGYVTEFGWIRHEAEEITLPQEEALIREAIIPAVFTHPISAATQTAAVQAVPAQAPYAR